MKRCFWLLALLFLALTGFSQQYSTGLLFDEEAYALQPVSAKLTRSTYTNIPARYSLKDYCPTPKSQGRTGTCTAWATAFNARTISESVRLDRTDKAAIDANTFSPSFVYNQIRLRSGCDQGTYIHHALDLMMADGVSKFSQYGFDCYREIGSTELGHASQYKIYDYKRLFSSYESDKIQPIKIALANKRPVVFGMRCPDSFHGAGDVWEVEDVEYTNRHSGGHAMAVIGYDDSKYDGAFLVENSWGTNWGNGGYTWIKYPDFNKFTFCAYEIIEEPPVQVDIIGSISFNDFNRKAFDVKFNSSSGEYETEDSYASGSFFRFYVTNENPAWLYAISTDHTGEIYEIFPHADTVSAFVSANNSTLAFPDEEHFIKMDEKTGTDVFCIIYSKRKLDYKAFVADMNSRSGSLKERVLGYFGDAVIEPTSVEYDLEEIAFAAKSGVHTVLPIFINIKHHQLKGSLMKSWISSLLFLAMGIQTYAQQSGVVYEFNPQEDWLSDVYDRSRNQFKGRTSTGFYMSNSHRSHRFYSKSEDFTIDLSRDFDFEFKYIYTTPQYSSFSQGQYVFLLLEGSDETLEIEYMNSDGSYASITVRKGWERLDYHSAKHATSEREEHTLNFKKEGNKINIYTDGVLFRSATYSFSEEQANAQIKIGVKAETRITVTGMNVTQSGGNTEENHPPLITIIKPGQSRGLEVVKVETQEVLGVALDDDGIAKVLVNGMDAKLEEGGKFSIILPMVVGANKITVEAFDKYGLSASKTVSVNNAEVDPDKDEHVAENKVALIIGNSTYTNAADLQGRPINDANDMATTLESIGFTVIKTNDANLQEMNDAIRSFGKQNKTADVALFYYAGHGLQTDQENYLVPIGAEISTKDDVEFECIKVATIQRLMETNRSEKLNLLILDACRNNPFKSWQRGGEEGLADMTPPSGTLIAFATAPGQTAANGNERNGLYTGELIQQLKKHQRIEDVFINTRIAVEDKSGGEQSPWELARLRGIYYLIEE